MASIIREQTKGIYQKIKLPDGQIKHELIARVDTKWLIAIYKGKDDIISITKDDETTRTYKVKYAEGFSIKIGKTYIGSMLGAESLFETFERIEQSTDYKFKFLEKIWDYVKPIKL